MKNAQQSNGRAPLQERCSVEVWHPSGNWGHGSQCKKRGKIKRGGKWFCGTHDPEAIKAKNEAQRAKWNAEEAAQRRRYARLDLYREAALSLQAWDGDLPAPLALLRSRLKATAK